MRYFDFAKVDGQKKYEHARLPSYGTKFSAGADFYSAVDIVIPSLFKGMIRGETVSPVLVPTGVRALMPNDEALFLYNRSSNPLKSGLVLANGVGVVDCDYADNEQNDIMFAFYNYSMDDIEIKIGTKIGQGVFMPINRVSDFDPSMLGFRLGGFGSTDKQVSVL